MRKIFIIGPFMLAFMAFTAPAVGQSKCVNMKNFQEYSECVVRVIDTDPVYNFPEAGELRSFIIVLNEKVHVGKLTPTEAVYEFQKRGNELRRQIAGSIATTTNCFSSGSSVSCTTY